MHRAKLETAENARATLIAQGCEPFHLDFLVQMVNSARSGNNPLFPTLAEGLFTNAEPRHLDSVEARIQNFAQEIAALWTAKGESFVRFSIKQPWMLELPNLLTRYRIELAAIRTAVQARRPRTHEHLKCTLVKYVRDATGHRHGWHDAQLALLCHEERRAWTKWRANHYRPPPQGLPETGRVIMPIETT